MDDIKEKVLDVFEYLEIKVVSLDDVLDIDSLEWVDLVLSLEEDLRIEIPDKDIPKLETINDIISYVKKKEASFEKKS